MAGLAEFLKSAILDNISHILSAFTCQVDLASFIGLKLRMLMNLDPTNTKKLLEKH